MESSHPLVALLGRRLTDEDLRECFGGQGKASTIVRAGHAQFKDLGVAITLQGRPKVIAVVYIYLKPFWSFTPFAGDLPYGIGRDWDRERVRGLLGEPIRSGGMRFNKSGRRIDGDVPPGDMYLRDGHTIQASFDFNNGRLTHVTLATLEGTIGLPRKYLPGASDRKSGNRR